MAPRRIGHSLPKIQIGNERELRRYVVVTTLLCVIAALTMDVANQLLFFSNWVVAIRSWIVIVGVVVLITPVVARYIGVAHLTLHRSSRTDDLTGLLNRRALLEGRRRCPPA